MEKVEGLLLADSPTQCTAVCTIDNVLSKDMSLEMRRYALRLKLFAFKRYFRAVANARNGQKFSCPDQKKEFAELMNEIAYTLHDLQETFKKKDEAGSEINYWSRRLCNEKSRERPKHEHPQ